MVEDTQKRYADDITLQELVRLRVENERLRGVLRVIQLDFEQAKYAEDLNLDWIDDVDAALQQNGSE